MKTVFRIILLLLMLVLTSAGLKACENMSVRDAAFQEERDVHRLCLITKADDTQAEETSEKLQAWLAQFGQDLNVEFRQLSASDQTIAWTEYGLPSAPPATPVVVLSGYHRYDRKGFLIDHWDATPTAAELEQLRTSPAREEIRRAVLERVAVVLYVPGAGGQTSNTESMLQGVVAAWAKKERLGLGFVRVERDDPQERLLLAFLGIKPVGPDWVAAAFGRGKLMTPLVGEEITEDNLNEKIALLLGDCSCLRSASSLGVDLPLVWSPAFDKQVVLLRAGAGPASQATIGLSVRSSLLWTLALLVLMTSLATFLVMRLRRR
jgi:hypothetical protein